MTHNEELAAAFEAAADAVDPFTNVRTGSDALFYPAPGTDIGAARALRAIAAVYRQAAEREANVGTAESNRLLLGPWTPEEIAARDARYGAAMARYGSAPGTVTLESERDCGCPAGECREEDAGRNAIRARGFNPSCGIYFWACGRATRKG